MQQLLDAAKSAGVARDLSASLLREVTSAVLEQLRTGLKQQILPAERELLVLEGLRLLRLAVAAHKVKKLRHVINATGVVLHTNLGRAPLSAHILAQLNTASAGYATLEYNLAEGHRGRRDDLVRAQLCELTGAQDALVVNNCAAAVLLACTCFGAGGKGFVVSRGELVEIGGGFRVPDVITACGARLIEVGTTNKTRVADYAAVFRAEANVAAILSVHRSNFAIVGFTESADVASLAQLAHAQDVLLLEDLGSGALLDLSSYGLPPERTVQQAIADDVDVVMFSGDKLLGGPQAGFLLGKSSSIAALRAHPLMRALRPGRLVFAALEAVLHSYQSGHPLRELPALAALTTNKSELRARCALLLAQLEQSLIEGSSFITGTMPSSISMTEVNSTVGGGTLPTAALPSWAVSIRYENQADVIALERRLRTDIDTPIIGRIEAGALLLDVRTIFDHDLAIATKGLAQAVITTHKGT